MTGIFGRFLEQRRVVQLGHPSAGDPVLVNWFGGPPAHSGVSFDEKGALSWTALSAGVRLSAASIGSLPWGVFERLERGRTERSDHAVWWLLHEEPNPEQTPMEFHELQQAHTLFWGTSFAEIVRDGTGTPRELWPLNPDNVREHRDPDGSLWWRVNLGREQALLPARDVLVVRGFSTRGILGERLAELHREAIGLGIATEIFTASFFGQGAMLSGFLEHPGIMSKEAQDRLTKASERTISGLTNAHRLRVLEEGMKWHPTSVDPEKAQLLLGRKHNVSEAARILLMPPHMLYDLERATFSNIEHQSLEYVRDHVRAHVVRREQRYGKQLFGRKERGRLYVKANVDALVRGDMKTTIDALAAAITHRIITPNEAREVLDRNPGPAELDEFQVSPNLRAPSEEPQPVKPAPKEEDDREGDDRVAA